MRKPVLQLNERLPGILGLFEFRPETATPLQNLAETLLRGPSPLSSAERELIAAYTSRTNQCVFCCESHAAASRSHYGNNKKVVDEVLNNLDSASVTAKMKALLKIAGKVAHGGLNVTPEDVEQCKYHGANEIELHDTVLIAAAFCMYNRYVDGLATVAPPSGDKAYEEVGDRLAQKGYLRA